MISSQVRRHVGVFIVFAIAASTTVGADTTSPRSNTGKITPAAPAARPPASASKAGRGPLPDPALLDGSAHAPEKKSEHGMIGDFELPGDENVRGGKVGGPQNQNASMAGGGQQQSMPMGLPQSGGAGGQQGQQPPQGQQAGGGAQGGEQQAGGAQPGGPQNPNAGGNQIPGGGDPNAQPQGIQVAELGGDASGQQQQGGPGGPGDKPPPVAIGDPAMRIETSAAAQPGVVGAQQQQAAGHTQQHEKGTGSGGKGTGGAGGPGRIEKGRTIPAGL